ncbi:MAG: hypothetical protein LBC63_05520 [Holophagales bacterium]|nr:hypothetical protein [Holophagales bacterium]
MDNKQESNKNGIIDGVVNKQLAHPVSDHLTPHPGDSHLLPHPGSVPPHPGDGHLPPHPGDSHLLAHPGGVQPHPGDGHLPPHPGGVPPHPGDGHLLAHPIGGHLPPHLKKKLHISQEQFQALRRIPHIDHCKRLTFHHHDPDHEWEVNEIIVEFDGTELSDGSGHIPETGIYNWFNYAWVLQRE